MKQDTEYIHAKLVDAARAALSESPLNTNAAEWTRHIDGLVDDFLTTIEVYLSENTPTDIQNEPTDE